MAPKRILSQVLIGGVTFLLLACSLIRPPEPEIPTSTPKPSRTPTPEPTQTPEVVAGTITLWHAWEDFERSALSNIITAFQVSYPGVQFDVRYIPALDLKANFEAASMENMAPSILIAPGEWGVSLFDQQYVIDLTEIADENLLSSLNPAAVQAGRYRQALINLPMHLQGVALLRNKAIIPEAPETFEDLVRLSNAATRGEKVGAVLERGFYYSAGHLYGLGAEWMTAQGDPAFQQDDYRPAMQWMNLIKSFERAGPTEYMSDNDINLFKEKRIGFIIDGTWRMYELADAIEPLNLAIDPWPTYGEGRLAGFIQAESIYLTPSALAENPHANRLFLEWLLSPESQKAISDVNLIPAVKSSPEYGLINQIGNPFVAQAMLALSNGAPYPLLPEMAVYNTYLEAALQTVLFQGAEPHTALEAAFDAIQASLPDLRAALTPSP